MNVQIFAQLYVCACQTHKIQLYEFNGGILAGGGRRPFADAPPYHRCDMVDTVKVSVMSLSSRAIGAGESMSAVYVSPNYYAEFSSKIQLYY